MRRPVLLGLLLALSACSSSQGDEELGGGTGIGGTGDAGGGTGHAGTSAGGASAGGSPQGAGGQPNAGSPGAGGISAGGATTGGNGGGTAGGAGGNGQSGSAGTGPGQGGSAGSPAGPGGSGGSPQGGNAGTDSGGSGGDIGAGGTAGAGGDAAGAGGTATGGASTGGAGGVSAGGSAGSGGSTAGTGGGGSPLGEATITVGAPDRILLLGMVVTPDQAFDGAVLVEADKIACVGPGDTCSKDPGAAGATIIDTKGIIAPGLIDMHNHILFDIFDDSDWLPSKSYTNHNTWTNEPGYKAMLAAKHCFENASQGNPTWCPPEWGTAATSLKCEMDKYGEIKGLIAGTTSIVGLPGTSAACFASVARSIDSSQNDTGTDYIQTSALFPPSTSAGDGVCANYASGKTKSYLIHCGEGTDASALAEYTKLDTLTTTDGCLLAPQTVITHGTAFTATEFMSMASAGVKLTWSAKSNFALYGATADIPAALDAGVLISIGPDWSMGGSVNMLDELRFDNAWDDAHFGDRLSPKDLVVMSTSNAAKSLGLDGVLGTLDVAKYADLFVVGGDPSAPYDAILAATPTTVRLVMVGGKVLYGDAQLKAAGPAAPGCEDLAICGAPKFICVAESSTSDKLNQTLADIQGVLGDALTKVDGITDPAKLAGTFSPLAPLTKCP